MFCIAGVARTPPSYRRGPTYTLWALKKWRSNKPMAAASETSTASTRPARRDVPWSRDHEAILVEWADKAACYRWLHSRCHMKYKRRNYWFTIPVIIMSTVTGTANFAQERFSDDSKQWVSLAIGTINIVAGVMTTIQQFLKISELNEAHRVSSIAWDKFYRNVKVELAKSPPEREPVNQALKVAKEEFDRLMETSPAIAEGVIEAFKKMFKVEGATPPSAEELARELDSRKEAFATLKKPEICDVIESTRESVYTGSPDNGEAERARKEREAAEQARAEEEARARAAASSAAEHEACTIAAFREAQGRSPTSSELGRELAGQHDGPDNIRVEVADPPTGPV